MKIRVARLYRAGMVVACGLLLGACAAIPARLQEVAHDTLRAEQSLGELLEVALRDDGSEESEHALGHFVSEWFAQREKAASGEVVDGERRFRVTFATDEAGCYLPGYFDRLSAAEDYVVRDIAHHRRPGVGAPLLALRENTGRESIEQFYPKEAITRPLTAHATEGASRNGYRQVTIRLLCPLYHKTVREGGKRRTLAADFSAPWAALLERTQELKRTEILDLLRDTPAREPRLYLMEPYDPDKEPLIMIHGLLDTPLTWSSLSNDLWAHDGIRERYQIWHYLYNTSAPALYSGRLLSNQLRELRATLDPGQDDAAMQSTTVLAHSMGGIVTRRMISRPGNVFWDAAFTRPLESLELTPSDRESLKKAFFWEPERHVKRVIFVAVPHRGSGFADNFVGRLGRALVKPPSKFRAFYERISEANPGAFTPEYAQLGSGKLDSVHALSPKQPTLKILSQLPPSHPVAIHSIIGNRGKSGPVEESSDGIVPYWSSHYPGADSEKIVPAGHAAFKNDEALAEIVRILELPRGR